MAPLGASECFMNRSLHPWLLCPISTRANRTASSALLIPNTATSTAPLSHVENVARDSDVNLVWKFLLVLVVALETRIGLGLPVV